MASPSAAWNSIAPAIMAKKPSPNMSDNGEYRVMTLRFEVPLDHMDPLRETLTLHAELVYDYKRASCDDDSAAPHHRPAKPSSSSWNAILRRNKPYILYLCGGPGDGNKHLRIPGLNKFALERGYQVLYVDYRGTGKSQPVVDAATISRFRTAAAQAEYISFFRQDNIARDLEAIRLCLSSTTSPSTKPTPHPLKWTIIGQSFGGWIALTYLSFLPTSLSAIYLTAGLAPITKSPTEVYTALYRRVIARNEAYYRLYPADVPLVRAIATHIFHHGPIRTASAGTAGRAYPVPPTITADGPQGKDRLLTAQSFLTLGRVFGDDAARPTGFERVHRLVQRMAGDLDRGGALTGDTLACYAHRSVESFRLHRRPLYAVLHEAIYVPHRGAAPSAWAALRVGLVAHPGFSWLRDGDFSGDHGDAEGSGGGRLFFSGEMIFPFMLAAGGDEVRVFWEAAEVLSLKRDWGRLYDLDGLMGNREVKVRAMAFESDMYVDFGVSREVGGLVGGCEVVHGEDGWGHGALKEGGKTGVVLGRLFGEE
ncbi:Alpha/Beta hydrolase protein [Podospora appendiculata]|uniref:Alpha/Beta hydrolase protein n=1 Tax=Podospora appendiculata TaxID=314037 RepID=A0AAE0X2C6_9PEZI|nr:Alpha/Beta hydrolase protein [Podospora appendiculata]